MTPRSSPADFEGTRSPLSSVGTVLESESVCCNWPHLEILSGRHDWVELSLPCSFEAADQFSEFAERFFAELPGSTREGLRTAMRELVLNAIEWGGRLDGSKRVRVAILQGHNAVLCRIVDPGNGFKVENLSHASISNPSDNPCKHLRVREQRGLRAGGFGLAIVQEYIDALLYNDSGNKVVFIKYL